METAAVRPLLAESRVRAMASAHLTALTAEAGEREEGCGPGFGPIGPGGRRPPPAATMRSRGRCPGIHADG